MTASLPSAPANGATSSPVAPSRVRRLPLPVCEPPYDDERAHPEPVQGTLALDYQLASGLPAEPAPQLRLVEAPSSRPAARRAVDVDAWSARQPSPSSLLPDPRRWTAALVQGLFEVLSGERPVQQLARWTDERLLEELSVRSRAVLRRGPVRRARATVRSVHVCQPLDGVVEATALVQLGARCRAVAVRLEGLDGRWRATVAHLV